MSHNKTTVGGQSPDSAGEISIALNDLSDVSGSPSTGDALVYGGANWAPTAPTGDAATTLPYSGYNEYDAYVGGAKYFSTSDYAMFSHYRWRNNMIGGPYTASFWVDATDPPSANTNTKWVMAYDLPSGLWLIDCTPNFTFSSSTDYVDLAWFDTSGNQYSSLVRFQEGRPSPANVWAVVDVSAPTRVYLKCVVVSGSISQARDDTPRNIAFQFIKIG